VRDDQFYQLVKDMLPEIIEAAITSLVLGSRVRVNSFAYCEGVINEFKDSFTPGYLGYLRKKWKDMVEQKLKIRKTAELSNKGRGKR
jgi:hypothetical protein